MKRLTDRERFVELRRWQREKQLIEERITELLSADGEISPEEKERVLNMRIEEFIKTNSLFMKRSNFLQAMKHFGVNTVRELTRTERSKLERVGIGIGAKVLGLVEDELASWGLAIQNP